MEVKQMVWLKHMNDALEYMEDNLDGEISFEKAARLACCSQYQFQRMFSFIIGVPLSEYLRRRRLTKAALDLQNGDKVIDVALRYGYDSPTAFNRAFQTVHGISPSAAQKPDTALKAYPRVTFQITVKGAEIMDYRIVKKDAFRIVGVKTNNPADAEESFKQIPLFWQETQKNGIIPQIAALMNGEPMGILGVSTCANDCKCKLENDVCVCVDGAEAECYYYIAAATNKPVPEGMYEYTVPECTWAIFPGAGDAASIQELQKRIFAEWLPTSGYEWSGAADVEVYLNEDPVNMKYEIWMPVEKKA